MPRPISRCSRLYRRSEWLGSLSWALGGFLALVGIVVFAFTLWCVFLYVRRLAGSTAAWVSIPVLLGIFGPPHVIWASDLSLHAALYAGFFPRTSRSGQPF